MQRAQGWGAWPTCSARAGANGSAPAAPATGSASSSTTDTAPSAPSPASERSSGHVDRSSSRGDYTVRAGDTLSGIADRHGTTWRQLYAANESVIGGDPHLIVPGQRLEL